MKKGDVIIGQNGISYTLIEKLGTGGQAKVFKAQEQNSNKIYAYKHYNRDKKNVKSNIEALISMGTIEDKSGKPLDSVVMPITIVNGEGDSFGYIMDLVDLKDYTTLTKAWRTPNKYPSCRAICKIIKNFALFFEGLHGKRGMCYKDVNEGNIFFNPVSGDIKIIDNDNIGYPSKQTIKGTPGYMAPEVILGDPPDARSDQFSLAVFVYRLLVGGYPFEGPYTENYCEKHDVLLTDNDVRKVIFGKSPIFVWNPNDKRNSIEALKDPQHEGQTACWKRLPTSLKNLFINTFVTNLSKDRKAERATDADWYRTFDLLEKNIVTCPKCKAETFSEDDYCFECNEKLNLKKSASTPNSTNTTKKAPVKVAPKPPVKPQTPKTPQKPKSTSNNGSVKFKVLSRGEAVREVTLSDPVEVNGSQISKHLESGTLFKIMYNSKLNKMGIKNMSRHSWKVVHADSSATQLEPGKIQILEVDMKISIIPKTAQLNVLEIK